MLSDLAFLQSLKEDELRGLVIMPLLEKLDYLEIRSTHGMLELGKDIVFARIDPLEGVKYYCAIVKRVALTGSVSSNRSIREVFFQAQQALGEPFFSPFDGSKTLIDRAYFITPYDIDPACINSIKSELQQNQTRIHFIDGPALLSYLRQHLPTLLSSLPDHNSRYLAALARRLSQIRSLEHLGSSTKLSLSDIYTGGDLTPITADEARFISFSKPDTAGHSVPLAAAYRQQRCVLVLADVGAGKTTLLQRFALDLIEAHATSSGESRSGPIPLFVSLYAFDPAHLATYESFTAGLEEYIRSREGFRAFSFRHASQFTLLFDGFDELASHYKEVAEHLNRLSQSTIAGLVVTSRPSRIPALGEAYAVYRLKPFTDEDIEIFLQKWFPEAVDVRQQLISRIRTDDVLSKFCRSPLMLTLYAILASRYSIDRLPTRRTDIYELIVKMLLDEWDRSRGIKSNFSFDGKQYVLEQVAFETHSQRRKQFGIDVFNRIASEFFKAQRIVVAPAEMFQELLFRSSLIRPSAGGGYEFIHLSFQEYLCAKYLMRSGDQATVEVNAMNDEWWKNAGMFYFGLRRTIDGTQIVGRRRARGGGYKLVEFLGEADYTSEATKEKIYRAMASDLLYTSDVTQSELELCATFGDDVLTKLDPIILGEARSPDRQTHINVSLRVFNFIRLLLLVNRANLNRLLQNRPQYLERVSEDDLIVLLEAIIPRLASSDWVSYYSIVAEALRGRLRLVADHFDRIEELRSKIGKLRQNLRRTVDCGGEVASGAVKVSRHTEALLRALRHHSKAV